MEAARAQHVREKIVPAIEQGTTVICDRFTDSTIAYQGGGRKMDCQIITAFNNYASGICRPDLTILLDLPPECGFRRVAKRGSADAENDRFEAEKMEFHHRVREKFLDIAKCEPERVKIVDASLPQDDVASLVEKIIDEFIR